MLIINWKIVIMVPLFFGGAISDRYMGVACPDHYLLVSYYLYLTSLKRNYQSNMC